jgi:hypothetical protein
MGAVDKVWQCGKGAQGPVFTHRVLRKHRAQVGFGSPLHACVREAATRRPGNSRTMLERRKRRG